jgi:TetR/AcrR family transcriptional regulator, regulator of mycofactocin system
MTESRLSTKLPGMTSDVPVSGGPRRGRPRGTSARELELIALRLFAEQGFEETTIDQIAAAAGVSRRTFFRYYVAKSDVLWHEFDREVETIRRLLAEAPDNLPVMAAVRRAVLAANHYRAQDVPELRMRMSLIGTVPELTASAAIHYDAWERAVSDFVARRTGHPADSLYPLAVGRSVLAACRAAFDRWAARADADLTVYLDAALRALEAGFADDALGTEPVDALGTVPLDSPGAEPVDALGAVSLDSPGAEPVDAPGAGPETGDGPRARTTLTPEAAQAVIGPVVPQFRVTEVVARGGGEVNAVYEVRGTGDDRPLIVKVYPERWGSALRWRSKLAKEVYVYGLLARNGIDDIPRILRHEPDGVPELPSAFAVLTRLDGEPLAAVRDRLTGGDVEGVYRQMGRMLAAVHRITADRWGYVTTGLVDAKPSNTAYVLDQFTRKLRRFQQLGGDPALARAIDRHVARHEDLLAACRRPSLCHNDFHDGNVIVARVGPGWRVSGYLDVENAVVADPLLDLAKTDYYSLRHDETARRAFIRGYGRLPADWETRVALYRLHHALEFWNWSAGSGKRDLLAAIGTDLENLTAG